MLRVLYRYRKSKPPTITRADHKKARNLRSSRAGGRGCLPECVALANSSRSSLQVHVQALSPHECRGSGGHEGALLGGGEPRLGRSADRVRLHSLLAGDQGHPGRDVGHVALQGRHIHSLHHQQFPHIHRVLHALRVLEGEAGLK